MMLANQRGAGHSAPGLQFCAFEFSIDPVPGSAASRALCLT